MTGSSDVSGFYRKSIAERREFARQWAGLTEEEARAWEFPPGVDPGTLDRMIENVIGVMPLPLGVATHFQVNGKDYLVPMAIEEPSVVAFFRVPLHAEAEPVTLQLNRLHHLIRGPRYGDQTSA